MKLFELVGVIRVDGMKAAEKKISAFERKVKKAIAPMRRFGKQVSAMGMSLTKNLTLPIAAAGFAVLKFGGDFEKAMTDSLAIMGDVSKDIRSEMDKVAIDLSKKLPFSAKQAADAYFFLASAGKTVEQSMALLPKVAEFAAAGNFDLALATDLLTDAQSALGLTSKDVIKDQASLVRVSDVLVKANTLANASVEQFSKALTTKAGTALRALNKDVEEGVAVLAAYADQGVKSELAGNQLNIVLRELQKNAIKNGEAFKNAGIEVFDSNEKMNNMGDIVGMLEKRLGSMTDKGKKTELMMLGFSERSIAAMITLLGTSDAIKGYEAELRKAGGTTKEVADKQMKSFNNQLTVVKNKLVNVAITFSQSLLPVVKNKVIPMLEALIGKITSLAKWFNNLPDGVKNTVFGLAAFLAVAGPSLFIIGKLISSVKIITSVITGAKLAMVAFNVALSVTPIGLIIAGVVALGVAIYALSSDAKSAKINIDHLKESAGEQRAEFDVLSERLVILSKRQNESTKAKEDYLKAVSDMQQKYPGYFKDLGSEKTKHEDVTKAVEETRQAIYDKIAMQMREKEVALYVEKQIKLTRELNKLKDIELTQAASIANKERILAKSIDSTNKSTRNAVKAKRKLNSMTEQGIDGSDVYGASMGIVTDKMKLQTGIVYDNKDAYAELSTQKDEHLDMENEIEKLQKEINDTLIEENKIRTEYSILMSGIIPTKESLIKLTDAEKAALELKNQVEKDALITEKQLQSEKEAFISDYASRIEKAILGEMELLELEESAALSRAKQLKLSEEQMLEIKGFYAIKKTESQGELDSKEIEDEKKIADDKMAIATEAYEKRKKLLKKEVDDNKKMWDIIKDVIKNAISSIFSISSMAIDNKITLLDQETEKEKEAVENSVLSKEDKQKKFDEIDEKADKKKKELQLKKAKSDKASAIVSATISTFEAAAKALTAGPIIGWVLAGIVTALGMAKVAMIASQPLPQLAEGAMIRKSRGGTAVVVGEGSDDETVLPMRKGAFEIADRIMGKLSSALFPVNAQPQFNPEFAGASNTPLGGIGSSSVHLHIGTLVADKQGLKQLERTLYKVRVSEEKRRGE